MAKLTRKASLSKKPVRPTAPGTKKDVIPWPVMSCVDPTSRKRPAAARSFIPWIDAPCDSKAAAGATKTRRSKTAKKKTATKKVATKKVVKKKTAKGKKR